MPEKLVELEQVKKYFPLNDFKLGRAISKYLHAVDNVSFHINKGEIFGIVGESGSGKSTIGRCILNLHSTNEGKIYFKGTQINNLNNKELKPYRKSMQMIFQNPYSSFNPHKSIGKLFIELGKVNGMLLLEAKSRAEDLLEYVNLPKDIMVRRSKELSGGQLQRLAIARSLMLQPEFIVADEPVSALDVSVQAQILNLLLELRDKLNLTIMFISHDLTVVENICDRVAVFYLGIIVELADTKTLFSNPLHPYTKALLSAKPKEHPDEITDRIILKGDIPNAIDVEDGCRFADRCPRYKYKSFKCDNTTPELLEVEDGHYVACHYPFQIDNKINY